MSKSAILVTIGIGLLLSIGIQVPKPVRRPHTPMYHASKVGFRWVYQRPDGEFVEEITSVKEQNDGSLLIHISYITDDVHHQSTAITITKQGTFLVALGHRSLPQPFCILKHPVTPDSKWEATTFYHDAEETWKMTVRGLEAIRVPAGTFRACRVDAERPLNEGTQLWSYWYAADIGLVYSTVDGKPWAELKSFSTGRN